MKILFTGASSFTGYWFVKELYAAKCEIFATFTQNGADAYAGTRGQRVRDIIKYCNPIWSCPFGQDKFLGIIKNESWNLLCHHAADVRNYKSIDFDICAAVLNNTANLQAVLKALGQSGCERVVVTGSVFEQHEGAGDTPLRAFSPYGLSKGITTEIFSFWTQVFGLALGKFVIPNPFGPLEDARFTSYLANAWLRNETADVQAPLYVRDNIHISLLARYYSQFVNNYDLNLGCTKVNPSGYVESQGAFAHRFADEMRRRFNLPCKIALSVQTVFDEPRVRINTEPAIVSCPTWDETDAWDSTANYYLGSQSG